jgi:hypothetical protein
MEKSGRDLAIGDKIDTVIGRASIVSTKPHSLDKGATVFEYIAKRRGLAGMKIVWHRDLYKQAPDGVWVKSDRYIKYCFGRIHG